MQREKVVEEEKVQTQSWIDTITFSLSGNQTIPNPQYWLHLQLTEAKSFFWTLRGAVYLLSKTQKFIWKVATRWIGWDFLSYHGAESDDEIA